MKAKSLVNEISERESALQESTNEFRASNGWFNRFKTRHRVKNIQLHGEAASADIGAIEDFKSEFLDIIKDGNYTPQQVYNMDETALNWKKMPKRTFVVKKSRSKRGPKADKQRITLGLCANAEGTHVLTPLVINKSLKPRAFSKKKTNPTKLGVYWCANTKAWMTKIRFEKWFHEVFAPEVEAHMLAINQSFKILLLLDNAPGHPQNLEHPNITVLFLPPNTTALLQPQDQGIIASMKRAYLRYSLETVLDLTENIKSGSLEYCSSNETDIEWIDARVTEKEDTVIKAWKTYDIVDCIKNVKKAINELSPSLLNSCWRNLWPTIVKSSNEIQKQTVESEVNLIIKVAKHIGGDGFTDFDVEDIEDILIEDELTEAELLAMTSEEGSSVQSEHEEEQAEIITKTNLELIITDAEALIAKIEMLDPQMDRKSQVCLQVKSVFTPYYELLKSLKSKAKQRPLTEFFSVQKNISFTTSDEEL